MTAPGGMPTAHACLHRRVLAKYLNGTLRGLSQLVIDGAVEADLMQICDIAAGACVGAE